MRKFFLKNRKWFILILIIIGILSYYVLWKKNQKQSIFIVSEKFEGDIIVVYNLEGRSDYLYMEGFLFKAIDSFSIFETSIGLNELRGPKIVIEAKGKETTEIQFERVFSYVDTVFYSERFSRKIGLHYSSFLRKPYSEFTSNELKIKKMKFDSIYNEVILDYAPAH